MRYVLSADQFHKQEIDSLLNLAHVLEESLATKKRLTILKDHVLATLFFEPSTRTRLSFETSMHRLGGSVITSVGFQFSSLSKGETLFDTLKMVEMYADICAIRHSIEGASNLAAKSLSIPIINAGDGAGEHPSQALLDLYTINKHKPLEQGKLKVGFLGDIKYGRTIHSLYKLLIHYRAEMLFISPEGLRLSEKDRKNLESNQIKFEETDKIEAMFDCDVVYITRIQEERFLDHREYEKYSNIYIVDRELVSRFKKGAIIMHPLPRLKELSTDVDELPNAVYFEQVRNGVYIRMALLMALLNKNVEDI